MPYENPEGVPCILVNGQEERRDDACDSAADGVLPINLRGIVDIHWSQRMKNRNAAL